MNVDETGFRVDKKTYWIHVYAARDITLKFLHKSRGSKAIDEINIIPQYSGTIIHDCWASYLEPVPFALFFKTAAKPWLAELYL